MLRVLYININRQIYTLEVEKVGTSYSIQFDEKNFIIGLMLDGKRVNTQSVTPLENYHCSLTGELMTIEDRDFLSEGRLLEIDESLFFFLVKESALQNLQSVIDTGFKAIGNEADTFVEFDVLNRIFYLSIYNELASRYVDFNMTSSSGVYFLHNDWLNDKLGILNVYQDGVYMESKNGVNRAKYYVNKAFGNYSFNFHPPSTLTGSGIKYMPFTLDGEWSDSNGNLSKFVAAPATSTSPGKPKDMAYDFNYLYVCVAVNTWRRTPLSGF